MPQVWTHNSTRHPCSQKRLTEGEATLPLGNTDAYIHSRQVETAGEESGVVFLRIKNEKTQAHTEQLGGEVSWPDVQSPHPPTV